MTRRTRKPSFMDELMAEHITMPGCPDLIVTRADAYAFLKSLGYTTDPRESQFGCVQYMVFNPRRVALDEPLSPVEFRDRVFAAMARNAGSVTDFFRIPTNRVVELGTRVEL